MYVFQFFFQGDTFWCWDLIKGPFPPKFWLLARCGVALDWYLNFNTLLMLCHRLILPYIEYYNIVWASGHSIYLDVIL